MYCRNCGSKIPEGDKFCIKCGTSVEVSKASEKITSDSKENANMESTELPKKGKKKTIIILVLLCMLGMIAIGCIYTVYERNQELKGIQQTLAEYMSNKEKYNLTDGYKEYEDLLLECKKEILNKDISEASELLGQIESVLSELIRNNDSYVQEKLEDYQKVDLSIAEVDDKKFYNEGIAKVQELQEKQEYSSIPDIFKQLDEIFYCYVEPKNEMDMSVQQIDASDYPNIKLYLQLTDLSTGEVPNDLEQAMFFVRKKNANGEYVKQEVKKVAQLNEIEKLNIDMVADVSGSMYGEPLDEAKNSMNNFINTVQFGAGDMVELISFSTGVYLEQEFTNNQNVLADKINYLETDDMTSLYDALYTAVTRVATQEGAKCVIAFTDGLDNYSHCSATEVVDVALRYHVPIFIIGIDVGSADIQSIAMQTGGNYYNINSVFSMQDIYNEIYRQEKQLYMMEFVDSTSDSLMQRADVVLGYHSLELGGNCDYSYTPNVLMNVNSSALYTNGPESVVEGYMRNFDDAMTESDFSLISGYLKKGSNIYITQKKYVKRNIEELLDSYEIVDVDYSNSDECVVTTRETYYVQKEEFPMELLTQECKYKVECDNGKWYITDFADKVHVLSRINQ